MCCTEEHVYTLVTKRIILPFIDSPHLEQNVSKLVSYRLLEPVSSFVIKIERSSIFTALNFAQTANESAYF
jgi:hypothetical protein